MFSFVINAQTIPILAFAAFPLSILAWSIFQRRIRPLFIPGEDIRAIAAALEARHGDGAITYARIEEDRAWRYCRNFEQGRWRLVGGELERRRKGRLSSEV